MITTFKKSALRNAQYLEVSQQLAERFKAIKSTTISHRDWNPSVAALAAGVQKLDQDFKQQQGSDITAQISEADQKRDRAYQTFATIIRAQASAGVTIAQKVQRTLDKYNLRTTMQMDEENTIIQQINQEFDTILIAQFAALGVHDHWATVFNETKHLADYLRQRDDERATIQTGLIKADRATLDEALDRCFAIVNAALIYEPSQALTDDVARTNAYLNRVRTQMLGSSVTGSEEVSGAAPSTPSTPDDNGNQQQPSGNGGQQPSGGGSQSGNDNEFDA